MKKTMKFFIILILVVLTIVIFKAYANPASSDGNILTGNSILNEGGDVQIVKMRVENGRYLLEPSTFKVGVPVRIEADIAKVPGCAKSIVIPAFNVAKSVNYNDNIIQFTPNKAGTFNIACSMNMYKGTFNVLAADGTKSTYVEKAPAGGSRCGGGCGGCGG